METGHRMKKLVQDGNIALLGSSDLECYLLRSDPLMIYLFSAIKWYYKFSILECWEVDWWKLDKLVLSCPHIVAL